MTKEERRRLKRQINAGATVQPEPELTDWFCDDGNSRERIRATTSLRAASEYVRTGHWGDDPCVVLVHVWRTDAPLDDEEPYSPAGLVTHEIVSYGALVLHEGCWYPWTDLVTGMDAATRERVGGGVEIGDGDTCESFLRRYLAADPDFEPSESACPVDWSKLDDEQRREIDWEGDEPDHGAGPPSAEQRAEWQRIK